MTNNKTPLRRMTTCLPTSEMIDAFDLYSEEEKNEILAIIKGKYVPARNEKIGIPYSRIKMNCEWSLGKPINRFAMKCALVYCDIYPFKNDVRDWVMKCELSISSLSGFPQWLIVKYLKKDCGIGDLARDWAYELKTTGGDDYTTLIDTEMSGACSEAVRVFNYAFLLYKKSRGGVPREVALDIAERDGLVIQNEEDPPFADDGYPVNPIIIPDYSIPGRRIPDYQKDICEMLTRYAALKVDRPRQPIRPRDRFNILQRDNFTCQYCGAKAPDVELQLDHIVPHSKGGTNDVANLRASCVTCNIGKGNVSWGGL